VLCGLFWRFDDEKHQKKLVLACPIDGYWSECSPNGGIQWLLVKPWTSSIGQCARYCTAALQWPSKQPALLVFLLIVVYVSAALADTGAIRSK
jgi:hypothetical protein